MIELGRESKPLLDLTDELSISAAAQVAGLVVLHYDAAFARLAGVGGAAHEWVVPQGTV